MAIINLGVLAHVNAGKTSLTERILFETGVIDAPGSVDGGSTQTDTLDLERQRGITIQSAVVSFTLDGTTVNLIDTPGHADFIAEVERSLLALDGVILVVSAVEGIQPQTRRLVRVVRSSGLPMLVFINKIDRIGARPADVLSDLREQLGLRVVPMATATDCGSRGATAIVHDPLAPGEVERIIDTLAAGNDRFLGEYVRRDGHLPRKQVARELVLQARRGAVTPVWCGSAITGAGVELLLAGVPRYLPFADRTGLAGQPLSARVFKIHRLPSGEKLASVRIHAGQITRRERVTLTRSSPSGGTDTDEERVTGIDRFIDGAIEAAGSATAGEIVRLHGLRSCRVGDVIGEPPPRVSGSFNRPTLESIVSPEDPTRRGELAMALQRLAEQDPLIDVHRDDLRGELSVRLYGEVQKEVITATLADQYGLPVRFSPSTVVCIEQVSGTGSAVEWITDGDNPFLATVGIRIEPAEPGSGIRFQRPSGALDLSFYRAIEETVFATLSEGLRGWAVTDSIVTVTETAMAPTSVAMDYRRLTPLVVMAALREAGTRVLEPVDRFELEAPEGAIGDLLQALVVARAQPDGTVLAGDIATVTGTIPTTEIHRLEQRLPAMANGRATFVSERAGYQPVVGEPPSRPRSVPDSLDRPAYLALVSQRILT
ncbi:MAG TPA: translation factor GTPase family protein [Thermomicrobiales bacterium]|jgi:ribosomal protection tetracycline resistance protein|nr:translation factor GTPase family protein [Thermomicrobiales bacterium]